MGNVLSAEKRQQVIALGRLGWSLRRIEEATGVRRETASTYLRAAGVVVRPPGRWGQPPNPALLHREVSTEGGAAERTVGDRCDARLLRAGRVVSPDDDH